MDTAPLHTSRDFRLLFTAGAIFYFGGMITYVALPFQLWTITHSNVAVGLVGLVELFPLVVFGLYGGALADHVDRRRLLIGCGVAQVTLTALLALNAALDRPHVWVIYTVAFFLAAAQSVQRPSKEALLPRTVAQEQLTAANALEAFAMQAGVLVGPAIGGLLLAHAGAAWCYLVDVVGLTVACLLYRAMVGYPHRDETTPPSLAGIGQGLRYAISRRDLLGTYLVDIAAMLLAIPVVLFPALAQEVFAHPALLGLLYSAETVGAMLATLTSGWAVSIHTHGKAIVIAAAAYGACIAVAGLAPSIWVALLFFALSGAADMISGIFRMTVWNTTIPESMRGRLAGIEMLGYSLGPLGGQVRAGVVADLWSVRGSITSGGVACVAGVGLTAAWLKDFWHYDVRTDPHARAERERRAGEHLQE